MEEQKNFGRVRAVQRLCGFYPGICLTTEEKAWKNLSQGSHIVILTRKQPYLGRRTGTVLHPINKGLFVI